MDAVDDADQSEQLSDRADGGGGILEGCAPGEFGDRTDDDAGNGHENADEQIDHGQFEVTAVFGGSAYAHVVHDQTDQSDDARNEACGQTTKGKPGGHGRLGTERGHHDEKHGKHDRDHACDQLKDVGGKDPLYTQISILKLHNNPPRFGDVRLIIIIARFFAFFNNKSSRGCGA